MADMSTHSVNLVSWDTKAMQAIVTVDGSPDQHSIVVPQSDSKFSSSPPSEADAIKYIKDSISIMLDDMAAQLTLLSRLPNLSSKVGTNI